MSHFPEDKDSPHLVMAVMAEAKIILLDEPASALDRRQHRWL